MQVDGERHEHPRQQFDEAIVAHELGKLPAQVDLDVLGVERLERPVARLLEEDHEGHNLTGMQAGGAPTPSVPRRQQVPLPLGREPLPELIYRSVQVEYTHGELLLALSTVFMYSSLPGGFSYPELTLS